MRQEISKKLDELQQRIESGDFASEARSVKQWGGADVIISRRLTDSIKEWRGDIEQIDDILVMGLQV